jgi:sugar lactone lactonase YvrE
LAVDGLGNLYIAESNRVRKVSPAGIITTVAGNGNAASADVSGDGGPATNAAISPGALAADQTGNVYFVEYFGYPPIGAPQIPLIRIRKISVDGIITTIAGYGTPVGLPCCIGGMAADGAGSLYLTLDGMYRVSKLAPDGSITIVAGDGADGHSGDGGPATAAQLRDPRALAVDGNGNLYISEWNFIRKVSSDGMITTVAGVRGVGYSGDDGPAAAAGLDGVVALTTDPAGSLYMVDTNDEDDAGHARIRKVSTAGIITTVVGNGEPPLSTPLGVAVDSAGTLYVADTLGNRLRRASPDGRLSTIAGDAFWNSTGDGGPASVSPVGWPAGLALDNAGRLYIAATLEDRIRVISPDGIMNTVAGLWPIVHAYSGDGGPATRAQLSFPKDVAPDGSGNIYIADSGNNRVRVVSPSGIITTVAGAGVAGYSGDGDLATNAQLSLPSGLALDTAGNLYVADTNNFRIRKISTSGIITTIAGNGTRGHSGDGGPATSAQLDYPTGLKIDTAGNLYIGDRGAVRMVSPDGIITTVAGSGVPGFSGDGGPATGAQLGAWGLAFDRSGKLYVADPAYNTVRILTPVQ